MNGGTLFYTNDYVKIYQITRQIFVYFGQWNDNKESSTSSCIEKSSNKWKKKQRTI